MWILPLLVSVALAQPPDPVLIKLDTALKALADPTMVERYLVTTRVTFADTDGDDPHTDVVLTELRFGVDGKPVPHELSHSRDGEPISQEELAKEREEQGRDGEGQASMTLAAPAGEHLGRYVFGPTTLDGDTARASYTPAPDEHSADDLATGWVAWAPASETPLWIEFVPVEKPFMVKSLTTRVIIGSTAGQLHSERVYSTGVGGVPGFRKKFEFDLLFHDVEWKQ